jgi:hypothetical protein
MVVVSLKEVESFECNGPRGCIVPMNIIKFDVEQDALYLSPQFDIYRFPIILARNECQGKQIF